MKIINRTVAVLMCAVLLGASGCSGDTGGSSEKQTTTTTAATKAPSGKVELKSYEFPQFMNEHNDADMLGIQLFKSFEPSKYVTESFMQPSGDYVCSSCIDGCLYVFTDNGFKGLVNGKGEVVVKADTYTDIRPCSQGMLVLSRNKELNMPDDYAYYDDNGKISMVGGYSFNPNEIKVEQTAEEKLPEDKSLEETEDEEQTCRIVFPRNDRKLPPEEFSEWDSIEPMSAASIDTTKAFSAFYKAKKKNMYYIIAVDKYYNYSIFSGAYGLIRLKVGDSYGECYILNFTDYDELLKMVDSFGSSDSMRSPSKEQSLDYIQIVTGLDSGDTLTYTISADGFCLTDTAGGAQQALNRTEQPVYRYFTLLDKESFISLVQWVDKVLSQEYESLVLVIDSIPEEESSSEEESSEDESADEDTSESSDLSEESSALPDDTLQESSLAEENSSQADSQVQSAPEIAEE